MEKDAFLGPGRRLTSAGEGDAEYAPARVPQAAPTNLTQELAQLLAASIAQNQANRTIPAGMPSSLELTNLAQLVSAASAQRTLAPVFKDGLSALSYARPASRPPPSEAVAPELPADDDPMPIPSTWREPIASDDQRWYRQQMGAAFLGLVAGLMIVVPSVLWLSGRIGSPKAGLPEHQLAMATGSAAEIKTLKVQPRPVEKRLETASSASYLSGLSGRDDARAPQPMEQASLASSDTAERLAEARRVEEVLAQAARRESSGDVAGAREMLAAAEDGAQGPVTFALAETYDPNMLAAWGTRGISSDVVKAKSLYRKALELGIARAQTRLQALE
jgi:hypothetical protein